MFETFSAQSREAIERAQHEARHMGHGSVGVEHLLLGLLMDQQAIAGRVLTQFGLTVEAVRNRVRLQLDRGACAAPEGALPFSDEAKSALQSAYRFGLGEPGTEHVLVAIVGRGEGGACDILRALGADPQRVRFETKRQGWRASSIGPRPRLEVRSVPLLDELDFGE